MTSLPIQQSSNALPESFGGNNSSQNSLIKFTNLWDSLWVIGIRQQFAHLLEPGHHGCMMHAFDPFNASKAHAIDIHLQAFFVHIVTVASRPPITINKLASPLDSADRLLGVGIVQLVVESEAKAKNRARLLIQKVRQEIEGEVSQQEIVELIETIVVYKFPYLSRQEVEDMLGLSDLKQTKVYQEAKQEGKLEAVPKLLQFGLSIEQVAEALGLETEQVRQAVKEQL